MGKSGNKYSKTEVFFENMTTRYTENNIDSFNLQYILKLQINIFNYFYIVELHFTIYIHINIENLHFISY